MYHLVSYVVKVEIEGRSADVALAVPISTHDSMQTSDDHIVPYVEFSAFVEQRVLDVLLYDVCLLCSV